MIHLRNRLADYEIYVARYYLDRGAYIGAAQRAKQTIEQFDGAPAVRDALEVMITAYEALGMQDLAAQTREVYAANYSEPPRPGDAEGPNRAPWKRWFSFGSRS